MADDLLEPNDQDDHHDAQRSEPIIRLASWVRRRSQEARGRTFIVGIVGMPGCGKSTLAEQILWSMAMPRSLSVSLDDFYLTAEERRAIGRELRGPPGTHDLARLDALLEKLQTRSAGLHIPVFDREREVRLPSRHVVDPLDLIIIEGWFVGARCAGYERLSDAIDLLIYIDMNEAEARAARLSREASLRESGHGGMDEAQAIRFWETQLAPYFAELVLPLRERADALIAFDAAHHITKLELDRRDLSRALRAADRAPRPAPSGGGST